MGDTNIVYDEKFGINTFKREIVAALGTEFWNTLVEGLILPDIETECQCKCKNMHAFMKRLKEKIDPETLKTICYKVRHGLHPEQSAWARDELIECGDLDKYLKQHLQKELANFEEMNQQKRDFYGQDITDEVLEFVKQNTSMLTPVRKGNKLYIMAFPYNMKEYLKATDEKMKRYHACHCPFAKESILTDSPVSATLCNCSLGHVMNFPEALATRSLKGKVLSSVLNGDLTCTYEMTIPDDMLRKLTTERLILRPWKEEDAEDLFEYAKDPDVGPIAGWPSHQNVEESLNIIRNGLTGIECYAICEKESNKPIGAIELKLVNTSLTDREDECEIGFWLGKPFWGKGYMPEAATELMRRAFDELGMTTIWCGYYDGNTKSKRVQEKLGFTYHHTNENVPVLLMNERRTEHVNYLSKEQWKKRY